MGAFARLLGRTGLAFTADGSEAVVRLTKNHELVIADGRGKLAEAAFRKQLFFACTAVAGVAPGTALSTTPPFDLHNPDGSGIFAEILKVFIGYVSGTLGAGLLAYAENPQTTVPSTGTTLTVNSTYLGQAAGLCTAGQGRTVSATPTIIRPSGISFGASLASTANAPVMIVDNVDGEIIVPENQDFAIQGVMAAGSSPLIAIGVLWREFAG